MLSLLKHAELAIILKKTRLLVASAILVFLTVTAQDYFHSYHHQYSFYLSESILFNSIWLWFLPISVALKPLLKKHNKDFVSIKAGLFILIASLLHMAWYALSVYSLSAFFYTPTYDLAKMLSYTFSQDLYKYILVYGAVAIIYIQKKEVLQKSTINTSLPKKENAYPSVIIAGSGINSTCIPVEDIYYIQAASPYIIIYTKDKKHLHSQTLKAILAQLDPNQFMQVHKSTLVNILTVTSYKSRLNGDYDLFLENSHEIRLSRNYARLFKEKLRNKSSS